MVCKKNLLEGVDEFDFELFESTEGPDRCIKRDRLLPALCQKKVVGQEIVPHDHKSAVVSISCGITRCCWISGRIGLGRIKP